MRHPKRFCVKCNSEQSLAVRRHRTFEMYHCRKCGDEIMRVGDGIPASLRRRVERIDVRNLEDQDLQGMNLLDIARANPDVLSDDQTIWQADDNDYPTRSDRFAVAYALLTPRQREVVEALRHCGNQRAAARMLEITQQAVSRTLKQVQKKLLGDGCIFDIPGTK